MGAPRFLALGLVTLAAAASMSCFDPQHSDEVNALGGETNVEPGPYHRPGQPCRACHGGQGPGSPELSIAGTVYAKRGQPAVKPGVTVTLTSANGETRALLSNAAGNFYVSVAEWSPMFPVTVELSGPSAADPQKTVVKPMVSVIGRNGGCGFCHYGKDGEGTHMPPVFLEQ